jgi:hypothetical protein
MKTYLTYGAASAIAGAMLMMLLYLLGYHSDPEKLKMAQILGSCGGLAISITCIVLGTKARRAEIPPTEEFGYGQALFAGFMISLISSAIGIVTWIIYAKFVNPDFHEMVVQAQLHAMEARGMKQEQIDAAEKVIRTMTNPFIQAVFSFLGGLVFGTVISLITSAFLRRPAEAEAPPAIPS